MRSGSEGSRSSARATLVSGPSVTSVSSPAWSCDACSRASTAWPASGVRPLSGEADVAHAVGSVHVLGRDQRELQRCRFADVDRDVERARTAPGCRARSGRRRRAGRCRRRRRCRPRRCSGWLSAMTSATASSEAVSVSMKNGRVTTGHTYGCERREPAFEMATLGVARHQFERDRELAGGLDPGVRAEPASRPGRRGTGALREPLGAIASSATSPASNPSAKPIATARLRATTGLGSMPIEHVVQTRRSGASRWPPRLAAALCVAGDRRLQLVAARSSCAASPTREQRLGLVDQRPGPTSIGPDAPSAPGRRAASKRAAARACWASINASSPSTSGSSGISSAS